MVQHVYERAKQSNADKVVVATDDQRIFDAVNAFGGAACLTSVSHQSGTDRLQEAAHLLGLSGDDRVVNVQGDEPLIPPVVINQVADNLISSGARMATLCERIDRYDDVVDPNIVKVVTDARGMALYFSRAAIPFARDHVPDPKQVRYERHLGIYAYRVSLLDDFVTWPPGEFEVTEHLEQLRVLAQGVDIHVGEAAVSIPPGIDTERDLERTLRVMEQTGG